ncbi:MAG TPA: glucokinase [Thermoanaerobaculia bacterium]|nr:glucokinase [Thermoanaerobaculia bacterium]
MSAGSDRNAGSDGPRTLLLGGDVGGTKTNLGLFSSEGGVRLLRSCQYESARFPGLLPILETFLGKDAREVGAACFGIPAPVTANRAEKITNLDWSELDGGDLCRLTGIPATRLVNDLVATAEGLPLLAPGDLAVLQEGSPAAPADGNRVLVAAGTGLGMALLPFDGRSHLPVASEGGHMDFAPRNPLEAGLAERLRARYGRVSVERVVSGPGLAHLYEYLREEGGTGAPAAEPEVPAVAARLAAAEDPAPVITAAALDGTSPLCGRALDFFISAYGAVAGNLALLGTALGGVYLGGGIAPKILPRLLDGPFLGAFLDKGRFRGYLEAIPVRVVRNDRAAMFGAARLAHRSLGT